MRRGDPTLYPNMAPPTDAQWELVTANLGLIGFTITRFAGRLLDDRYSHDDAWQNGYLGLCKAATKYDPERARFSTYAVMWIRQAVIRGKYLSIGANDQHPLPATPSSLDHTGPDHNESVGALLAADDDPEADATAHIAFQRLLALADTDLERAILNRHLNGTSLAAVGARFGISGEAVRKHQVALHRRLRVALEGRCAA